MRLQTGLTLNNKANGGFEAFLGDLYPVLKEKWCKWLATTYSECAAPPPLIGIFVNQLSLTGEQVDPTKSVGISLQSSASNETPILDDPSSPGSSSSSAPAPPPPAAVNFVGPYRRPPRNHAYVFVPPRPTKRPLPDATSSEELSSDDEYDGRIPSNPDTDGESSHKINDNLFSTHEIDDESSSALEVDNESPTNEIENESSTSEIDNEPSFIRGINDDLFSTDEIDNDPSSVHEVDGESSTRGIDDNLFSVREIDNESSPLEVDGDESSTHEIDGDESSTHETDDEHEAPDVWALDERHPDFLHRAEQFLLTAPGGDNWRTMLLRYVQFEGLAAQVSHARVYCVSDLTRMLRPVEDLQLPLALNKLVGGLASVAGNSARCPRSHRFRIMRRPGLHGGQPFNQTGEMFEIGRSPEMRRSAIRGTKSWLGGRTDSSSLL